MHGEHLSQEDADEFALGVTDGERAREIALHILECVQCQSRVDDAEQLTARLALTAPVERPNPRMRERIFEATGIAGPSLLTRIMRVSGAAALIAALTIAGIALGGYLSLRGEVDDLQQANADLDARLEETLGQRIQIAALTQEVDETTGRVDELLVQAKEDRELQVAIVSPNSWQAPVVSTDQNAGPIGRFVWDPDQSKFWFLAQGLSPRPSNEVYELFAGADGSFVSLGTFDPDEDGFVQFKASIPEGLTAYDKAVVTVENRWGDRTRQGPAVFFLDLEEYQ